MEICINRDLGCHVSLREQAKGEEGAYIDLKAAPERVDELPEARQWPAFGKFLADINRLPDLRTTGSKAFGSTPDGYEDPFVDIAFCEPILAISEDVQFAFRGEFQSLNGIAIGNDLVLETCASYALFPDGHESLASRLWFRGARADAEAAFPVILGFLAAQRAEIFRSIAEDQDADIA